MGASRGHVPSWASMDDISDKPSLMVVCDDLDTRRPSSHALACDTRVGSWLLCDHGLLVRVLARQRLQSWTSRKLPAARLLPEVWALEVLAVTVVCVLTVIRRYCVTCPHPAH